MKVAVKWASLPLAAGLWAKVVSPRLSVVSHYVNVWAPAPALPRVTLAALWQPTAGIPESRQQRLGARPPQRR